MLQILVDTHIANRARRVPEIPQVFCWTKMGTESGQPLETILRRKELERRSGDGLFAWGIGNSLGMSTDLARKMSPYGEVDVLFSPMKSTPKPVDVEPPQVLLWLGYVDVDGSIVSLPSHMLVTSRGGSEKRSHYALLCYSAEEIRADGAHILDAAYARNLASLNPIGASQVTSVVRYENKLNGKPEKPYRIAFQAKLHGKGFVKLAHPIAMDAQIMSLYRQVCNSASPADWYDGASEIRSTAQTQLC
jgi:hypothetical protein